MPTLTPLGPAPAFDPADVAVGDFEWRPSSYELSCLGALDADGYRPYRTLDAYFRGEYGRNHKVWFHAGGLADFTFKIHWLLDRGRPFEIVPSGSAALRLEAMGTSYLDSFFLLRAPLASIGEGLGEEKEKIDYETATFDELCPYNERDNSILRNALMRFFKIIVDLGGYPRSTAASTAMDLFRRVYQTSPAYVPDDINAILRTAYFASDVQPAAKRAEIAYLRDRNSSFPAEMRNPVPWRFVGRAKRLPRGKLGFGLATVTVPHSCPFPPLPVRAGNGGIYFPTGTIHGWYSQLDIDYAAELGCNVAVHEWLVFEPSNDLAGFVNALIPLRLKAKHTGDEFWALALKIVLNSLYGKFGEKIWKEIVMFGRSTPTSRMLYPGVHVDETERPLAHEQVHVCAWITAGARIALHRQYWAIAHQGHRVYNWDTDCVFSSLDKVPNMGPDIGQFNDDGILRHAKFGAPKFYSGWYQKPGKREQYLVKAKGVAEIGRIMRDRNLELDDKMHRLQAAWATLESGQTLKFPSMRRFRAVLQGNRPGEDDVTKTYRGRYPKRRFVSDDESVPWKREELP
jgi:hypothetical protein